MIDETGAGEVQRNMDRINRRLHEQALVAAREISLVLEGYAKTHHRWMRDTGMTDASTRGTVERVSEDIIRVILSAGMEYNVTLELARSGKWAWLWPAVEANRDQIRNIIRRRLTLKGGVA